MAKYIVQLNPLDADRKGQKTVLKIVTSRKIEAVLADFCFESGLSKPRKDLKCFGMLYFVTNNHLIEVKKTGRFQN